MLALVQQMIALGKNTGVLDILKVKLLGKGSSAEKRSERVIQAACDNIAELASPLILGIAILGETLYKALRAPETFYDQGIFRHWRGDVSVPQTLITLALVTILRVIFLRVELTVSQYFADVRARAEERKVSPEEECKEECKVSPEVNTAKADADKRTAIDEWKAVLQRIQDSSYYAKVMIAVGITVQIILVITESAWYAYYQVAEAEQDDSSSE